MNAIKHIFCTVIFIPAVVFAAASKPAQLFFDEELFLLTRADYFDNGSICVEMREVLGRAAAASIVATTKFSQKTLSFSCKTDAFKTIPIQSKPMIIQLEPVLTWQLENEEIKK